MVTCAEQCGCVVCCFDSLVVFKHVSFYCKIMFDIGLITNVNGVLWDPKPLGIQSASIEVPVSVGHEYLLLTRKFSVQEPFSKKLH